LIINSIKDIVSINNLEIQFLESSNPLHELYPKWTNSFVDIVLSKLAIFIFLVNSGYKSSILSAASFSNDMNIN